MDNYEDDTVEETTETPDVELEEVEETETEAEEQDDEVVDYKALYEKEAEARKKAEQTIIKAKTKPKTEKVAEPKTNNKLSIFDQKAIFNADIDTQEDLDEILDYAERKGISVAKALESTVIKATLAENAQIRRSAQAVNTGTGRRASGTISDERLMADAKAGKMPDSIDDIAKLARMRIGKK